MSRNITLALLCALAAATQVGCAANTDSTDDPTGEGDDVEAEAISPGAAVGTWYAPGSMEFTDHTYQKIVIKSSKTARHACSFTIAAVNTRNGTCTITKAATGTGSVLTFTPAVQDVYQHQWSLENETYAVRLMNGMLRVFNGRRHYWMVTDGTVKAKGKILPTVANSQGLANSNNLALSHVPGPLPMTSLVAPVGADRISQLNGMGVPALIPQKMPSEILGGRTPMVVSEPVYATSGSATVPGYNVYVSATAQCYGSPMCVAVHFWAGLNSAPTLTAKKGDVSISLPNGLTGIYTAYVATDPSVPPTITWLDNAGHQYWISSKGPEADTELVSLAYASIGAPIAAAAASAN